MTILEKLRQIQVRMKAPKNLYNSFGKYYYRNAEGIQEALKPFEDEYNVTLTLEDDIVEIGGRNYVKATARLYDTETDETVIITAFAREAQERAGMDPAQVTGAASSYARKYALNGMFLLDDTKDPDTDEAKVESESRVADTMKKDIIQLAYRAGVETKTICEQAKIKDLSELTPAKYAQIKTALLKKIGEKDGAESTT
ncbi:MAG: ERF family protein [Clostridia bacterium]|nr:ERF family protein [Clostridia bacterium]